MPHTTTWRRLTPCIALALGLSAGCDDSSDDSGQTPTPDAQPGGDALPGADAEAMFTPRPDPPAHEGIYSLVHGCYAVEGYDGAEVRLIEAAGEGFAFGEGDPAHFRMQASDLGTYLLYDAERRFFVAEEAEGRWRFTRPEHLESDLSMSDIEFKSPAEWHVQVSSRDPDRFQLQHRATEQYLTLNGLTADEAEAAVIAFLPREGCAEFPEMTVDAVGEPERRTWPNGDLYGIAELHSHMMTHLGFGASNMFHGAPFHRLGVEHALQDCSPFHGEEGRRDVVGFFYDSEDDDLDIATAIPILSRGESDEFVHHTEGYPEFTEWPNGWRRSTHQMMYYRWMERAWRGGMRLVFQHATGNSVLCELGMGLGSQIPRISCNDMVSVDYAIDEVRALERYIDAQWGGPGEGWFRLVETPAEAREVIAAGKMAVVLGIEISNLFDCFLTPPEGFERCTPETVTAALDRYYEKGVRVIFPVHKFDNGFGPGDGHNGIIELGNLVNSGHFTNKVEECAVDPQGFDQGPLTFGGLNQPREVFDAPPEVDMSRFAENPLRALSPHFQALSAGAAEGNFCQNATLTDLGEFLMEALMRRGMMPDIAHLPRRSMARALEMLQANSYPALSTHNNIHDEALMALGGMTQVNIGGCGDPATPGGMARSVVNRTRQRTAAGAHPGTAFAFDLNGFAGQRRPRFGEFTRCGEGQDNPVTWPFMSFDGAVEFQQPQLGERMVDFNTEGFLHIGLLPELIQDARLDGASEEDLEPLFRSAEAALQMWERAEARAAELREQ